VALGPRCGRGHAARRGCGKAKSRAEKKMQIPRQVANPLRSEAVTFLIFSEKRH
jgi:hypothetical protein